jgi:hypothetical protein
MIGGHLPTRQSSGRAGPVALVHVAGKKEANDEPKKHANDCE